uniref:Claudin 10e n=1 Tax=Mastacembelus armatus TaxID=205130 RepID=A0A3Q3N6X0_9TELE
MKIRVVQIWGFLMAVLGWIFVACTMAMDIWMISSIGGVGGSYIIKVAWYQSSLWKYCFVETTAIQSCYDFPVFWGVEGHIQIVRGLLIASLCLGMLGFVLGLIGMECTFIGGQVQSKYKKIYTSGCCHIISGLLSTCGYCVYVYYVLQYFYPDPDGVEYDLGTPVFLGCAGSAFHMTGGFFYLWSVCKPLCGGEDKLVQASVAITIYKTSKVSTVSELSFERLQEPTSKSEHTSMSGGQTTRPARLESSSGAKSESEPESESESEQESGRLSRSSGSTLYESKSSGGSRTASSLSGSVGSETTSFLKTSYI